MGVPTHQLFSPPAVPGSAFQFVAGQGLEPGQAPPPANAGPQSKFVSALAASPAG